MRLYVCTLNKEKYTGYRIGHYFVGLRPGREWIQTSSRNLTAWPPNKYAVIDTDTQCVVARSETLVAALLWARENQ